MKKTVIVSGASRGLGLAIARYIVSEGHNVIVTARDASALEDFRKEAPDQIRVVAGDIRDASHATIIAIAAETVFGQIDGLVINHGTMEPVARIASSTADEWRNCLDINLFSAITLLKETLPSLRKARGRILLTSTGAARHSYAAWGAYGASKAALKSLGDTLAVEEPDIITMSVEPGTVDTDMQKDIREKYANVMDEKDQQKFLGLHEEGKLAKPEQVGKVMGKIVLLAPKELSGQAFRWDSPTAAPFRE
ncbi:hypothetical protein MMC10_008434 [Thelotrema lepadinum]|nr:hypothetical protein [Thelotrema lepadinum]